MSVQVIYWSHTQPVAPVIVGSTVSLWIIFTVFHITAQVVSIVKFQVIAVSFQCI